MDAALQHIGGHPNARIIDLPFPAVPPQATEAEVMHIAKSVADDILVQEPAAVLCQGEFTLAFAIAGLLKRHGIPVLAACSERNVQEHIVQGTAEKVVKFHFVQFRKYLQF